MATASAGKKSQPGASRSGTTTARSANRSKSEDAGTAPSILREKVWTSWNAEDAAYDGWGVFNCIDMKTRKLFNEVQSVGPRFATDNEARAFVMAKNKAGDELAIKALRIVFRSKVGDADLRGKRK